MDVWEVLESVLHFKQSFHSFPHELLLFALLNALYAKFPTGLFSTVQGFTCTRSIQKDTQSTIKSQRCLSIS